MTSQLSGVVKIFIGMIFFLTAARISFRFWQMIWSAEEFKFSVPSFKVILIGMAWLGLTMGGAFLTNLDLYAIIFLITFVPGFTFIILKIGRILATGPLPLASKNKETGKFKINLNLYNFVLLSFIGFFYGCYG